MTGPNRGPSGIRIDEPASPHHVPSRIATNDLTLDRRPERSVASGMGSPTGGVRELLPDRWRKRPVDELRGRSAAEVFDDHLRLAGEHRFEEDIERNVSPECVVLERRGVFHGRDGVRELANLLAEELPDAPYLYTTRLVAGRMAFLEWTAEIEHVRVRDGADSFVIENGWIIAQTIHYTVESF